MGKSLVIKTQTSREDCANYVKSNYKDVDYGRIGKLRNSKCYNKTSRGGVSIGLYSPKSPLCCSQQPPHGHLRGTQPGIDSA